METLAQNTGIKSLSKAALGTAVIGLVKAFQAGSTITPSRLNQFLKRAKQTIDTAIADASRDCNNVKMRTILSNYNESDILKFYICKIIQNDYKLDDNIAQEFACLLNNYTSGDKQFIAILKTDYEKEKQANADAVLRGALGVGISSATVDSIFDSSTFGKSKFTVPKPESPGDVAARDWLVGTMGVATSTATAAAGIKIFKSLNSQIPISYKPEFKKIITAIVNVKDKINEITEQENYCKKERLNSIRNNFKLQLEEKIKSLGETVRVNNSNLGNFKYIDRNGDEFSINANSVFMPRNKDIYDINALKKIIYDKTTNNDIESDVVSYCGTPNQSQKIALKNKLENLFLLKDRFLEALGLSDKNENDISITKEILKDINSLLINLDLKDISDDEINAIKNKITEIERRKRPMLTAFREAASAAKTSASSFASSFASSMASSLKSPPKKVGSPTENPKDKLNFDERVQEIDAIEKTVDYGGRKIKKIRKNKTKRRKINRKRQTKRH